MREDQLLCLYSKECDLESAQKLVEENNEEAITQVSSIILDSKNKIMSAMLIKNIALVFTAVFAKYDTISRTLFIEFWKGFEKRDLAQKAIVELFRCHTDEDTIQFSIVACYSVILHASYEIYGGDDLIDDLRDAGQSDNIEISTSALRVLIEIFDSALDADLYPEQYQKLIETAFITATAVIKKTDLPEIIGYAFKAVGLVNPEPLLKAGKKTFLMKHLLTLTAKFHECIINDNQKLIKKSYKLAKLLTSYPDLGYKEEIFLTIINILKSNPPETEAAISECIRFVGIEGTRYKECKDKSLKKFLIQCIEPILAKLRYKGENPDKIDEEGDVSEMASNTLEILSAAIKVTHAYADIFFKENRENPEWQMRYAAVAAKSACVHAQRVTINDSINLEPLLKDESKVVRNAVISLVSNELIKHDHYIEGISTGTIIPLVLELAKCDEERSLSQAWTIAYSMPSDLEPYAMELLTPLCEILKRRESMSAGYITETVLFFAYKFIMLVDYDRIKDVVPMLRGCIDAIDGYDLWERKELQSMILKMLFSTMWSNCVDFEDGAINKMIEYMEGLLRTHPEHRWRIILGLTYISITNDEFFDWEWPYLKEIVDNLRMECIDEVLTVLQSAVQRGCMIKGAPTLKELTLKLSMFIRKKLMFPALDKALVIIGKALKRDLDGSIYNQIDMDLKMFSDHITQTMIGEKNTTMCALCYMNSAIIFNKATNKEFLMERAKWLLEPFFLVNLSNMTPRDRNRYVSGVRLALNAARVKEIREIILKKKISAALHVCAEECTLELDFKSNDILKKFNKIRDHPEIDPSPEESKSVPTKQDNF